MEKFKAESVNPITHTVINRHTSSVVFKTHEAWRAIMIADLLNQVDLCNNRIGVLSQMLIPRETFLFFSEYYRTTRQQAINVANVIGGGISIHYCAACAQDGKKIQATHKLDSLDDGPIYYCGFHATNLTLQDSNIYLERIW